MSRLPCVAAAFLAACTPATPREGPVALGRIAAVGGPQVRALAVLEDSRCPIAATCVWPGRVVVRADVILGSGTQEVQLTLGELVPVADGALSLTAVTPTRGTHPIRPGAYRFTFRFDGGL